MENELKNSEAFLKSKTGKETGFTIPNAYFSSLSDEIESRIITDNFAKKTAYNVPENYFDALDDKIQQRVSSTEKETKVISLKDSVLKIIPFAAAASIALFISLNSFVFSKNDTFTLDSLSDKDIEYWLESTNLNTTDISTVLEDELLLNENDFYFTVIKDESIEEYMNYIDDTNLFNEIN